jgi:hypothetical protein
MGPPLEQLLTNEDSKIREHGNESQDSRQGNDDAAAPLEAGKSFGQFIGHLLHKPDKGYEDGRGNINGQEGNKAEYEVFQTLVHIPYSPSMTV